MNNDFNRWTVDGIAYHESEARKEQGFDAIEMPDDLLTRFKLRLAMNLRYEHTLPVKCRKWSQWYMLGIDKINELKGIPKEYV